MRAAFIITGTPAFGSAHPHNGAAHKYGLMLGRLCDLHLVPHDSPDLADELAAADFVVTAADRNLHYLRAVEADKPWLLLANDIATMRDPHYEWARDERRMFEGAAGIIFATPHLRAYALRKYRLPLNIVVPLRPPAAWLDFEPMHKLPGTLVYAGGICRRGMVGTPWGYRCYHDLFAAAIEAGWEMHVYPTRDRIVDNREYHALGCHMHLPVPEEHLPQELSQYEAGLQAFNVEGVPSASIAYARHAVPNKTWLYLAAGIPTIGTNRGWASAEVYEGKWGVVVDPDRFPGPHEVQLPAVDPTVRSTQVMDADVPRIGRLLRGGLCDV